MWEVEEIEYGKLRNALNGIADRGGEIFQIIDSGTRKEFCTVIWIRSSSDKDSNGSKKAMKPVGQK